MYHTAIKVNSVPIPEFIKKYQDQDKFMAFCRECHNYQTRWSCPPLQFDANQFLLPFRYIYLIGVQVIYDPETIKAADTADKVKEITRCTLREVKDKLSETVLALERKIPGSVGLASGGCHLCERCSRFDELPCRYPETMRYSLDSFGFDLTAITSELLHIDLKWAKHSLPEYYTLVHALLTKDSIGNLLDNLTIA
ncbi:hypothetical protein SPACI_046700 [Sporomusa acidovorans DSM 3132]|uniref:Metal-binding protein n=1 Tax=Sporomusa acidovorans (strain ATCC 49682 / DSM 3132 / Mol) TaxID=1123286 RepID=A0ABZ3J916_SPOA4|nr:DUF2284 domain-containing protein [Sporomusa acidovorans]OZC24125.1 hypothetical protein SPACI_02260 [Sporomusa acidovorans DSM 3132]SDF71740.1 Predicted metal-binding protein [Sporomusa acidovorans]